MMNVCQFKEHMNKYFKVKIMKQIPETVSEMFDSRRKRFNGIEEATPSALNIIEVDVLNFLKKSKLNNPFLNEMKEEISVYIFEYVMPYYRKYRNNEHDFAGIEMIYDLYVYDKKSNTIISYLETRLGAGTFESYFQHGFIGMISVEKEWKKKKLSTFMLRLSSSFLWYKQRKKLYSGTLLSDEFLPVLHHLNKKTNWVVQENYWNELSGNVQERYLIKPLTFGVKVKDGNEILSF